MLQLDPTIPVVVFIKDEWVLAEAIGWFDYSKEDYLLWLVALNDGGQCWLMNNKNVRLCENFSIGRTKDEAK